MKALAALSLVSSFAVGNDATEQSLEHDNSQIQLLSSNSAPEQLYSTEPQVSSYSNWDQYKSLDGDSFDNQVMNDQENVWVVAYVHPTCGSCKRLGNEWGTLTQLESVKGRRVKFGYIDIDSPTSQGTIQKHTVGGNVPYTPTVYVYGADKQPVEYTGEYLSSPLNDYICNYCDGHGYGGGELLDAGLETPATPNLSSAQTQLESPIAPATPKAPDQGIGKEDDSSLYEGVAHLGLLRQQAKSALAGEFDITDEHLEQAKHYGQDQHGQDWQGYQPGNQNYVHKQGFTNVFPGYTSGQLYGQMNYGRDSYGKDAYATFGAGTAYTYAPGYGKSYGLQQAAALHNPTRYGKLLGNAYSQQAYAQPTYNWGDNQVGYGQTAYNHALNQPKQLGYGQTTANQLQLQAQNTGYGQRVQHHQLQAKPETLQKQLQSLSNQVDQSGGIQNSYGTSYNQPSNYGNSYGTGYQQQGASYGAGKSVGYGNTLGYGGASSLNYGQAVGGTSYGTGAGLGGYGDVTGYGTGSTSGYGATTGYGATAGYGTTAGYGATTGYGATAGYGQNSGYGSKAGYGGSTGYSQAASYGATAGYEDKSGYGGYQNNNQLASLQGRILGDNQRSSVSSMDDLRMSVAPSRRSGGRTSRSSRRNSIGSMIDTMDTGFGLDLGSNEESINFGGDFGGLADYGQRSSRRSAGRSRNSSRATRSPRNSRSSRSSHDLYGGFGW